MRTILFFLLTIAAYNSVFGQEVVNVDFEVGESSIVVEYDLINCPQSYTYDLRLEAEITNKFGVTKRLVVKSISGAIEKQECGRGKTILWEVLEDVNEIEGKLTVYVRIIDGHFFKEEKVVKGNKPKHQRLAGPEAALYSIILPGLGDQLVSNSELGKTMGWVVSGTYFYFGFQALLNYSKAQADYQLYQDAIGQSWMNTYYESANNSYRKSVNNFYYAGAVMGVDIVYVLLKGIYNVQVRNKEFGSKLNFHRGVGIASNGSLGLKYTISF